jgi:hypothetical protein
MVLRNVVTVLGTAAVTAALVLTLAGPRGDGVAQAGPAVKPIIARPQLTSHDCTFVLKTDKEAYESDEAPVIQVTASNPTDKPVDARVWVNIMAAAPTTRMSRMLTVPRPLWSQDFAFNLKPGETKSMSATCQVKLPSGQDVHVVLTDKKDAVLASSVGVPARGGPNQAPPAARPGASQP